MNDFLKSYLRPNDYFNLNKTIGVELDEEKTINFIQSLPSQNSPYVYKALISSFEKLKAKNRPLNYLPYWQNSGLVINEKSKYIIEWMIDSLYEKGCKLENIRLMLSTMRTLCNPTSTDEFLTHLKKSKLFIQFEIDIAEQEKAAIEDFEEYQKIMEQLEKED